MSIVTRVAGTLVAVVLVAACGSARPPSPPGRDLGTPRRDLLPNGVRVIVQEHRAADVVAVQLWVGVGGRDEAPEELGLAHYLEHMLFKGTSTRPPGFVDRDVERVGGRINAATSFDYTYYHAVLPAARMASAVEMLADVAVNAALDPALLDTEKRVVLEEMRLHDDNPRRFLARHLWELAFDGHPYGRPLIGRPDVIQALTRDTLHGFYRRHYVSPAFVVVVVGDVDADQALARVRDTFGRIPRGQAARLPAPVPRPLTARRGDVRRPGTHAYLGLAWLAPRLDHADAAAMELITGVLGQLRSARLTTSLREKQGLVSSITSGYTAMQAAGVASVTAQLEAVNLARVEREVLAEIARVRARGITEPERRRAVTAAEARHQFSLETAEGRAFALGRAETVWRMEEELAWVDRLRSVTLAQVRAVARRYFDPQRYARLALLPEGAR
ncbi:MAG: insulinase family protein [Candidatus Rokubacteria bacterium]|nr:insulinase family protein [Candidatus Rokubacteria bacterium]